MQIKALKANRRNPRIITDQELSGLKKAMEKFGDLGCIVFNRRSGALISGHQRSKNIPPGATITIEHKYKEPTASKTVAEGYVEHNGERFKYREVDADETWEVEAMLAANKHGGKWDDEILRVTMADMPNLDLEMAGFKIPAPIINIPAPSQEDAEEETETDEEYVRNTPQVEEQIPTEQIPSMVNDENPFDKVEEKIETKNVKHLAIIECPTKERLDELKKWLRTDDLLVKYEARMY